MQRLDKLLLYTITSSCKDCIEYWCILVSLSVYGITITYQIEYLRVMLFIIDDVIL